MCGFHLLEWLKLIIWKHSFPRHLIYVINVLVEVTNVIFVEIRNEGGGKMAAWIWGCQISHINRLHFSIFSNLTKSVNNYLCKRYVVFFSFRYAEICLCGFDASCPLVFQLFRYRTRWFSWFHLNNLSEVRLFLLQRRLYVLRDHQKQGLLSYVIFLKTFAHDKWLILKITHDVIHNWSSYIMIILSLCFLRLWN